MADSKVETIAAVVNAPEKAEDSEKNSIKKDDAKYSEKQLEEIKVKPTDDPATDDQSAKTQQVSQNCKKTDEPAAIAETASIEHEKHSSAESKDSKDDAESKAESCKSETEEKREPEVTKDPEPPQDSTIKPDDEQLQKPEKETKDEGKPEAEPVNTNDDQKSEVVSEKETCNQAETETKDDTAVLTDGEINKNITTNIDKNVPMEVESVTTSKEESSTKKIHVKTDVSSEVGIAGPPMAVSDLLHEEELRAEVSLPTEQKVQDHVAEWVENSAKVEELGSVEEEENVRGNAQPKKLIKERKPRKKKSNDALVPTRKSQRIVSNIIKKSIKCLNKMHAMEGVAGNGKKVDSAEKARDEDSSRASPKVPQCQQNGAALPEETAAAPTSVECLRSASIKKEPLCDLDAEQLPTKSHTTSQNSQPKHASTRSSKSDSSGSTGRKRKSTDGRLSANGGTGPKKFCVEQREQYISSLVGCEKVTADELAARADQLRAEVQALDELARAKEMEWNEILSMRKLKEEAYLRIERRRQVMGFMEDNGQMPETMPPASLTLGPDWDGSGSTASASKDKCNFENKEDLPEENSEDAPTTFKKEKSSKQSAHRQTPPKQTGENGRKQNSNEALSPENRQIGEGRQGAIVDVRSIIADYRLRHPETVPRRGRRMRNSLNVGLGAGGAMVETGHSVDSRPSSTDSCKSNPNAMDPTNNSMSFKDVLVQFAKLSQQQGEPVKTPQNYPDVTLHPVAPSPAPQNTATQQSGSLLHGILTKSQSPRPTTFSPTLARLLTAPERERNAPSATTISQQSAATQHLLQAYQGTNPVSITDLLSSSKARTEITITPVVNTTVQSHSNNLIHVDDVEEDSAVIEDRETRISSGGRDAREDRDSPPRCQGCHERAAQFVCAGCGNQWYCSRECQVAAWDEHSEVCSG